MIHIYKADYKEDFITNGGNRARLFLYNQRNCVASDGSIGDLKQVHVQLWLPEGYTSMLFLPVDFSGGVTIDTSHISEIKSTVLDALDELEI